MIANGDALCALSHTQRTAMYGRVHPMDTIEQEDGMAGALAGLRA